MSLVSAADLKEGGGYIIHAGGMAGDPPCLPMYITMNGRSDVSPSLAKYVLDLPAMRESLAGAIGNPVVFEYISLGADSGDPQHDKNIVDRLFI